MTDEPEGIHLHTITIEVHLDEDGDEIVTIENADDIGVVTLLGILAMCQDTVLHPPED